MHICSLPRVSARMPGMLAPLSSFPRNRRDIPGDLATITRIPSEPVFSILDTQTDCPNPPNSNSLGSRGRKFLGDLFPRGEGSHAAFYFCLVSWSIFQLSSPNSSFDLVAAHVPSVASLLSSQTNPTQYRTPQQPHGRSPCSSTHLYS